MTSYSLPPEGLRQALKTAIWRQVLSGSIIIGGSSILWVALGLIPPLYLLGIVPFMAIVFVIGGYAGLRRQREQWASFRVLLDENEIRLQMAHSAEISIRRGEIGLFTETPQGLVIRAADLRRVIGVPRVLQGYEDLRRRLLAWRPLDATAGQRMVVIGPLPILLALGAAAVGLLLIQNPRIVAPLATFLAGLLVLVLAGVERSPQADPQLKRRLWWLLLPTVVFAARAVMAIVQAVMGR